MPLGGRAEALRGPPVAALHELPVPPLRGLVALLHDELSGAVRAPPAEPKGPCGLAPCEAHGCEHFDRGGLDLQAPPLAARRLEPLQRAPVVPLVVRRHALQELQAHVSGELGLEAPLKGPQALEVGAVRAGEPRPRLFQVPAGHCHAGGVLKLEDAPHDVHVHQPHVVDSLHVRGVRAGERLLAQHQGLQGVRPLARLHQPLCARIEHQASDEGLAVAFVVEREHLPLLVLQRELIVPLAAPPAARGQGVHRNQKPREVRLPLLCFVHGRHLRGLDPRDKDPGGAGYTILLQGLRGVALSRGWAPAVNSSCLDAVGYQGNCMSGEAAASRPSPCARDSFVPG
mmetsp:Transcript_14612/g.46455  ORF Transcript_14612/g.46455 Transcript_14612/m.46455 type:complete len:343 (-) Transcript_14612:304-1332(-)